MYMNRDMHEHKCLFDGETVFLLRATDECLERNNRLKERGGKDLFVFLHLCEYVCVLWVCACMCTYVWPVPENCFHRGNMVQDKAAGDMWSLYSCVCMYMCVCIYVWMCVWSPLNDYYGLTPISRIESLHPGFFHSPGNGKENIFPSVAHCWDLVFWWDTRKHVHVHTRTCTPVHTLATDDEPIFGFAWYSIRLRVVGWDSCIWEQPILIKPTDIYTNTHMACCELPRKPTADLALLYLGTINHNDRRLLAPCGIFGWAGSKRKTGDFKWWWWWWFTHGIVIITMNFDLLEEGSFTKAAKLYWSQCIE